MSNLKKIQRNIAELTEALSVIPALDSRMFLVPDEQASDVDPKDDEVIGFELDQAVKDASSKVLRDVLSGVLAQQLQVEYEGREDEMNVSQVMEYSDRLREVVSSVFDDRLWMQKTAELAIKKAGGIPKGKSR